MENNENQDTSRPSPQEELADDVALLYSWANVEDATYRNFSRQPKSLSKQGAQGGKDEGLSEKSESNLRGVGASLAASFSYDSVVTSGNAMVVARSAGKLASKKEVASFQELFDEFKCAIHER